MDYKPFFEQNQAFLLRLINTAEGRSLFDIKRPEQIVKVSPNGFHFYMGRDLDVYRFIANFYTEDKVAVKLLPIVTKMEQAFYTALKEKNEKIIQRYFENQHEAFLHYGEFEKSTAYPAIYLTISTFTANGGGQGRIGVTNATYLTARNAASGTTGSGVTRPTNFGGAPFEIQRGYAPFDTSSVPDGATAIVSANSFVRCFVTGVDNVNADSAALVASTQASNTSLTGTDYAQTGTTRLATDRLISGISTAGSPGAANDFPLNSAGIANLVFTGYSKFAWRTAKEIAATQPSGNNNLQMVDNTNLLSIEYTSTSVKSFGSVTQAAVKKAEGVAIASVKKIMGVV